MRDRGHLTFVVLSLLFVVTTACTKSEGPAPGNSAAAVPAETPTKELPVLVDTAASSAGDASLAASPSRNDGAASGEMDLAAANAACGKKPLPDCPLQAWMKANTNAAMSANDLPALATALEKTAHMAPAGYTNWVTIATDGSRAAKAGDMNATKASCRTCHEQYKKKYKDELRARKI